MNFVELSQIFDEEWTQEAGYFFYDLKFGIFNEKRFAYLKKSLVAFPNEEMETTECLDKRFVTVLWYIPVYMNWQINMHSNDTRFQENVLNAISYFESRLTTILGIP